MAEKRGHREPVGKPADQRGLRPGVHEARARSRAAARRCSARKTTAASPRQPGRERAVAPQRAPQSRLVREGRYRAVAGPALFPRPWPHRASAVLASVSATDQRRENAIVFRRRRHRLFILGSIAVAVCIIAIPGAGGAPAAPQDHGHGALTARRAGARLRCVRDRRRLARQHPRRAAGPRPGQGHRCRLGGLRR